MTGAPYPWPGDGTQIFMIGTQIFMILMMTDVCSLAPFIFVNAIHGEKDFAEMKTIKSAPCKFLAMPELIFILPSVSIVV